MKNIIKSFIAIAIVLLSISSCKKCEYNQCNDTCNMIETFDGDSINNWKGQVDFKEIVDSVNNILHVGYGMPGQVIKNSTDFPKDLVSAGCKLKYDVAYKNLMINNGTNPTNGLIIYTGSFPGPTQSAEFVLNTSSALISGNTLTTIEVPLELATGTSLPSNAFGQWVINGIASPTASDISDFNTLIQNIDGIGFNLYWSDYEEEWFFDNFCISDCCGNKHIDIE